MDELTSFVFLKDHPEWVPLMAEWSFSTWKSFYPGLTLEANISKFQEHARKDIDLPLTVVAVQKNTPVGMCSLRKNNGYASPFSPWLASLFVLPEYRLHGIGKKLVQVILDAAKNLQFSDVFLYSFNPTIPDWYNKNFGLTVVSTDVFNERPITIMQKSLE